MRRRKRGEKRPKYETEPGYPKLVQLLHPCGHAYPYRMSGRAEEEAKRRVVAGGLCMTCSSPEDARICDYCQDPSACADEIAGTFPPLRTFCSRITPLPENHNI